MWQKGNDKGMEVLCVYDTVSQETASQETDHKRE